MRKALEGVFDEVIAKAETQHQLEFTQILCINRFVISKANDGSNKNVKDISFI